MAGSLALAAAQRASASRTAPWLSALLTAAASAAAAARSARAVPRALALALAPSPPPPSPLPAAHTLARSARGVGATAACARRAAGL